jgi:cathepsin A (carboxypeptidase C)
MSSIISKTFLLGALASLVSAGPNADKDLVPELMGQDVFSKFTMWSGYLALPQTTTKALHYVFVTSQKAPTTDPVVIWFNGGPGCSSMLGWAQEHGPYAMENGETTFHYNDYSWNMEANVLYIESPGGVGYSTCSGRTECTFDDDISAKDNLNAVLYFFETLFPEFQSNDLYISGESYAGIYVPFLVDQIAIYTASALPSDYKPNLKGFMVGNGCTNWSVDCTPAYMEMGYWHGLYDDDLYATIVDNKCEEQFERFFQGPYTPECFQAYGRFNQLTSNVNVYDVYGICYQTGTSAKSDQFELY